MERVEKTILQSLIYNEEYIRQVIPFIQENYFGQNPDQVVFTLIRDFFLKHNTVPTKKILKLELEDKKGLKQEEYEYTAELINSLESESENHDWLVERTEKWCKDQALYNAIMDSIQIIDGKDKIASKDGIPKLLQDALAISFDNSVGHEYFDSAEDRYDFYHRKEERLPFGLEIFDKVTRGGLPKKSLTCIMATTGGGKSLFMTNYASNVIRAGKNALYITLELAEERVAERIDCNLLDVPIENMMKMGKKEFINGVTEIERKTHGKLVIKEYPTGGAHAGHFKALLEELRTKKNFVPDIIFVDYLNLCASSRVKNSQANSYTIVKSIAEELRGLAMEYDLPVMTCTQTNRDGMTNSDMDMTNTSESIGLPQTLDFYFALISNDDLDEMGQLMVKVLKNRWNDPNYYKRFMIGIERSKFLLYDSEDADGGMVDTGKHEEKDDGPMFDKGRFGGGKKHIDLNGINFD